VTQDAYDDIVDYLDLAESQRRAFGWGEIAIQYAIDRMNLDDMGYFMAAVAHAFDHPYYGDVIEDLEPRPELDVLAETFKRAWIDRYGDVSSWPD
jgi:hypothetical protein